MKQIQVGKLYKEFWKGQEVIVFVESIDWAAGIVTYSDIDKPNHLARCSFLVSDKWEDI